MVCGQARFATAASSASLVEDGIGTRAEARGAGSTRPRASRSPGEQPPPREDAFGPEADKAAREYERLVLVARCRCSATARLGVAAADEIVHDAVAGYFLALLRGESIEDSDAYVCGAALLQAAMLMRTRARSPNVPLEEAQAVAAAAPPVDAWEMACLVESMPPQLAPWLADILRDVTDRDLAQQYGISVDAVYKRRQRALDWTRDVFLSGQDRGSAAT